MVGTGSEGGHRGAAGRPSPFVLRVLDHVGARGWSVQPGSLEPDDGGAFLVLLGEGKSALVLIGEQESPATAADVARLVAALGRMPAATGMLVSARGFTGGAFEAAGTASEEIELIDGASLGGTAEHDGRNDPAAAFARSPGADSRRARDLRVYGPPKRHTKLIWLAIAVVCAIVFVILIRALLEKTKGSAGRAVAVAHGLSADRMRARGTSVVGQASATGR